jgi:hypothetical protein
VPIVVLDDGEGLALPAACRLAVLCGGLSAFRRFSTLIIGIR